VVCSSSHFALELGNAYPLNAHAVADDGTKIQPDARSPCASRSGARSTNSEALRRFDGLTNAPPQPHRQA
jgi:hypothetical protein